jgi:hypothetical protein
LRSKKHPSIPRSQRLINALILEVQKLPARRVTDREVAQHLKMRPGTLSKWRNGGTKLEQVEWLLRLLERMPEKRWVMELREVLRNPARNGPRKN